MYPVSTIGSLPGLEGQAWPSPSPDWVKPSADAARIDPRVQSGATAGVATVNGLAVAGVALGGVLVGALGLWAWARWAR